MSSPHEIVEGLRRIAEDAFPFAVAWHVVLAIALAAWMVGWRPHRRRTAQLLCALLASAGTFAWLYGNPFNGSMFAALTATTAVLASRAPRDELRAGPVWSRILGVALIVFGAVYPHFLDSRSPLAYLWGAPVGLLPCPTLSLVVGVALLAGQPGGRAWSLLLSAAALFYGLFGAVRLGVGIDVVLVAGALGLVARSLPRRSGRPAVRVAP